MRRVFFLCGATDQGTQTDVEVVTREGRMERSRFTSLAMAATLQPGSGKCDHENEASAAVEAAKVNTAREHSGSSGTEQAHTFT